MSVPDSRRAGAPHWRSLSSALSRPRLTSCLDRRAPLTVLNAPPGFGKRTLVAGWLHHGGAPEHTIVWVPPVPGSGALWECVLDVLGEHPAVEPTTGSDTFDRIVRTFEGVDGPSLLVLSGVPTSAGTVLPDVLGLLDRCPRLDVVVCLPGTDIDLSEVVVRGIDHVYIPASDLAFTVDETTALLQDSRVERSESECAALCRALGGVPVLISAAATLARNLPQRLVDGRGRPAAPLEHLVQRYVEKRLDELDDAHRRFALSVAAAHSVTAAEATELTGVDDAAAALSALAAAGLVAGSPFDSPRTWRWPDAVRTCVLEIARRARPGHVETLLSGLARAHHRAGDPAVASIYAAEAGDWTTALEIVEECWAQMVDNSFDVLVKVLRQIPDEELEAHPSVLAGRALFTQMLDEHTVLHSSLPTDPAELAELGRTAGAAQTLYVATVQTLALRTAGEFAEAARLTRLLEPLVRSILEHHPEDIRPQLPLLRVQWGITLQLAGLLTESTPTFQRAYRGANAEKIAFAVQNAAGSSALDWAVVGDDPRAREWLRLEREAEPTEGHWGEMVRVSGRAAAVLVHLDELDLDAAAHRLDELGVPRLSEELWGFVGYCRAYYDLTTGAAYDGLTALHRLIASHRDRHEHGAFSRVLLTAAEVDLQLALGNGNLAGAIAGEGPSDHPLVAVTAARVEAFTGRPDVALEKLRRVSWIDCGYPRAHLEALLVAAQAHLDLEEGGDAVRDWQRACALAASLGNRRAFTLVAPELADRLVALGGSPIPGGPVKSVFAEPVRRVELSRRETDVLRLLADGSTHADIAKTLFVSPNTVKTQLRSIYRKLGAHTRVEAVGRARELRLLPVRPPS